MAAPDLGDLSALADIPDPVRGRAAPVADAASPAEASPTRPERRRRLVIGLVLALCWVTALTLKVGLRPELTPSLLLEIGLWSVMAVVALAIALHPGRRGVSLRVTVLGAALMGLPAFFLMTALAWSVDAPPVPLTLPSWGGCLGLATAIGLGPLVIALYLFRHAFVAAAPWRLGLLGAVSGLAGTIGCQAHCPLGHAFSHVSLSHGMPILVGAIAGVAWGHWRGRA
jgi:hypothetical protein